MQAQRSGSNRKEIFVLIVASVVLVAALVGAFVTWRGGDDGGADARDILTTTDSTKGGASSSVAPSTSKPSSGSRKPSSRTTTTAPSTPATTPPADGGGAGGGRDQAIALVKTNLEACVQAQGIPIESLSAVTYSAAPGSGPSVFKVTATGASPEGAATWSVDVAAGTMTGDEQFAQAISDGCENF